MVEPIASTHNEAPNIVTRDGERTFMAANTSLAVIVCRRFSRAKSFAQVVRYMIKMPLARAKAATASFPTLLDEGNVFFRIRRTHATGGSNSTAEGRLSLTLLLLMLVVVLAVAVLAEPAVAVFP